MDRQHMLRTGDLKHVKELPKCRLGYTKQFTVQVKDVGSLPVLQSVRSYAIGKAQRGFVMFGGKIYKLPSNWMQYIQQ